MFLAGRFRESLSSTFSTFRTRIQASAVHQESVMLSGRKRRIHAPRVWKSDFAYPANRLLTGRMNGVR